MDKIGVRYSLRSSQGKIGRMLSFLLALTLLTQQAGAEELFLASLHRAYTLRPISTANSDVDLETGSTVGGIIKRLKAIIEEVEEAPEADLVIARIKDATQFYRYTAFSIRKSVFKTIVKLSKENRPAVYQALIQMLSHENPDIVEAILITLGYLSMKDTDSQTIEDHASTIIRFLDSDNYKIRQAALRALRFIMGSARSGTDIKKRTVIRRIEQRLLGILSRNKNLGDKEDNLWFFAIRELSWTADTNLILPLLEIIRESEGVEELGLMNLMRYTHLSLLLNPGWLASRIEEYSLTRNQSMLRLMFVIARRFGYIDDSIYRSFQREPDPEAVAGIAEILKGGISVVTSNLLNAYLEDKGNLILWQNRTDELITALRTDDIADRRNIYPLIIGDSQQALIDRDLLFSVLRQTDLANIEDRLTPKPFDRKHETEKIPGKFYFITPKSFYKSYYMKAGEISETVFNEEGVGQQLRKILLPFMITDYLSISTDTRKEEAGEEKLKFLAKWRTVSKILTIDGTAISIKPEYFRLIDEEYFAEFDQECDLEDKDGLRTFLSKLVSLKFHNIWMFAILDPMALEKADNLISRYRIEGRWRSLSQGSQSCLHLFAYHLFLQPNMNTKEVTAQWEEEFRSIAEEEAYLKSLLPTIHTVPSGGIEIQSVSIPEADSYAWKRMLEHFGIPSPRRPEYYKTVEAAFLPVRSPRAYLLAIPILKSLGLHKKYNRRSALHISVSGQLGDEAKLLAIGLRHFRHKEEARELTSDERYRRLTRVMSKGRIFRNLDSKPLSEGENSPEEHTEIRIVPLQNTSLDSDILSDAYTNAIPGTLWLTTALFAYKRQERGEDMTAMEERLAQVWVDYTADLEKVYRDERYHVRELLNLNWYESTGDPRDPELVKGLHIVRALERVRKFYKDKPNLKAELDSKVKAMFSGYAAQAEKIIFEYRQQVSIPEDAKILNPLCDYYNPAIREAAQKITAGCKDDYEKARRLSTWVMKNIRRESPFEWFSTDKASVTLKESIGSHFSRVNLLIAMLRAVGVDAQYAVIKESKGRYEGIIVGKDYKSMAEELEHLFVAVGIDGERIFIDIDRSSDRDGDLLMDRFLLSEYSIEEEPTYYDDISQLAHERAAVYDRAKIREFGREILAYQNAQLLSRIKDRCAQISLSINGIEDNRQDGWRAIGSAIEDIEEFFAYAGRYDYTLAERFISDSLSVLRDIIMDRSRGLDPRLFSSTENDYRRLGSRIRNLVSVALTDGYIPEVVEEFEWAEERPLLGIFDEAWQSNFYPSRWDGQERADKMNLLLYSAADQIDAPDIKEVYLSSGMIRGKGSRLQFVIFKEPVRVDASISPKREEGRKIITEKLPLLYRQANKSFRERGPDDGLALRLVLSSMPESTDSVLGKPLTNMAVVHSYLKMRLKDMNLDISFFTDGPVVSDEEIERIDPGLLPYPEGVNIGIMPMSTAGLSLAGVLAQRGDIEGVNFIYFLPVNNLVGSDSDKGRAYVQYGIFLDKNGKIRFGQFEQPIELHAVCHAGISMSKSASQFFQTRKIPILNSLQMLSFIADKIAFGKFLEDSGLPYPKTLAIPSDRSSDAAREAIGKFVTGDSLAGVAVKRQFGGCGTSVKMFETDKMSRAVNFALLLKERDNNVIVQERIDPVEIFDSDGVRLDWNLRIIATWKDGKPVIDKVMIETRSREYGSEPVNKSQGAETMSLKKFFEKYDFSDKQREQLVSGAEGLITEAMIKLRDYAIDRGISPNELYAKPGLVGWDIIQREDGQLYIIEANAGSVGGIQTLESLAEEPERGKALMPLLHYLKEMAMDYKDSIGEDSRNDSENVRFPDPYAEVNNEISVTAIDSMIRLSMLYLWGAKFKEAEGVLYLLIEKGVRGNASVWTGLATVKYLQNQTAQAEVFARKAISVDRYSVEAWKQLAKILISKRQLLEARLIYRPLIAMNIKSPSLRIDYLNLLFRMSCSKKNSMEEAKRAALAFHRNAKKAFLAYIRELSETSRIRYPFWNQLVRWLRQKHPEVIEGDDLNRLIDMAEAPRGVDFSKLSMEDIRAFAQKRPEAIEIGLLLLGIKPAYLATRPRYASDFNMLADVKKAIKDMPEIKMIYLNDGSPIIYNEQSVRAIIENNPDFYGQFGPVDDLGIFMKRVFSEDFGGQLLGYGTQRNLKDAKYFLKICDIDWNPVIGFAVKESEASELGTKYVEGLKVFTGRPHRFLVSRVLNRAESSTVKRTAAELISAERVSEKFYQIPGLVEAVPDSFCLKRGWDSFRYCRISPTKLLVRESLLRDKSALADILTTFSQPELSASPRLGLGEGVRVVNSIASAA